MKKLNLQLGSIKEMLTKEEMKKVTGGYTSCRDCGGGGKKHKQAQCCQTCFGADCNCGGWVDCPGNNCSGATCSLPNSHINYQWVY